MSNPLVTSSRAVSSRQFHPELLDIQTTTPPDVYPVDLTETKEWLRVDGTDQDGVLNLLIGAATSWAEGVTRRAFVQRELVLKYAETPPQGRDFVLAFPPVSAIASIEYTDMDGAPQTIDVTDVQLEPLFGRVRLKPGASIEDWPDVQDITFNVTCGYSPAPNDPNDIPDQIQQAILGAVAQMYETRVDQPIGAQVSMAHNKSSYMLLQDFRVREF